jgi:hypothetical protein
VIDAYLDGFERRLGLVGVEGRDAERLLAETRDHLLEATARSDAATAVGAFGDPLELARQAAAELGTARTRTAALSAFAGLAIAGAVYAVLFLTLSYAGSADIAGGSVPGLGAVALAGVVFFPQLAFVAGCLALVRVLRLQASGAQPGEELRVQRTRVVVALAAGALTFLSLAVAALDYRGDLASWWTATALGLSLPLALALAGLMRPCLRSAHPWALPGERAGDATADLEAVLTAVPLLRSAPHPHTSRQLLVVVASLAAAGVAVAGVVAGDPFDGLVRAAFETVAVLACFAALGRRLALR